MKLRKQTNVGYCISKLQIQTNHLENFTELNLQINLCLNNASKNGQPYIR